MKVVKFGGSSLADGRSFAEVKKIAESDPERRVMVVSAPGKRFSGDVKVTDLLYVCEAHIRYRVSFDELWQEIAERYRNISESCGLSGQIEESLAEVRARLEKGVGPEYTASRGEYLNARLMAEYLGWDFVDAADWLFFDETGLVDRERSFAALRTLAAVHEKMVLPGFYGAFPDGSIHTFSRGGSDITGALAAAALGAEVYENWTDVSGVLMADPRIVEKPRPIRRLTYDELRELSCLGAEVLHAETVLPLRQAGIPLRIRNTNAPEDPGTMIEETIEGESEEEKARFISGITGRRGRSIVTLRKKDRDIVFLQKILQTAEKYRLPIEHLPSSVDSVSLVIPTEALSADRHGFLNALQSICAPDGISVCDNVSLVAVVGRRMARSCGVSGRLFAALGRCGINIRMIEQGADEISIIVGVSDEDYEEVVRILYDSFT